MTIEKRTGGTLEHSLRQSHIDDYLERIIMHDLEEKIKKARRGLNSLDLLISGLNGMSGNNVVIGIAEARTQISLILDDLKMDEEEAILSYGLDGFK